MSAFANNLRRLMKQHNLDQDALAQKMEVSRSNISQWVTGRTMPRGAKMQQLAEILNTTVNALLYESQDPSLINNAGEDRIVVSRAEWLAKEQELSYLRKIVELQTKVESLKNIENVPIEQ